MPDILVFVSAKGAYEPTSISIQAKGGCRCATAVALWLGIWPCSR